MDARIYKEWDELERWHWWFIGRKRIFESVINEVFHGESPRFICDIGCGAGAMMPVLSKHGNVWGIESSSIAIETCLRRGLRNVILAESEELPFRNSSLDALALFDVIEHIDDDDKVLRECQRVCRKNATIIVSVPAYQFLMSPNDIVADHKRRYSRRVLVAKLRRSGFRTTKATYYNTFLFPLICAFIMTRKAFWRLSGATVTKEVKGNISYKVPEAINALLLAILTLESKMIRKLSFPFGHSLVCTAIKE